MCIRDRYNSVEASSVVPEEFEVPFGKARIRREGTDLSMIRMEIQLISV